MSKTVKVSIVSLSSIALAALAISFIVFGARGCRAESPPVYTSNTNVPHPAVATVAAATTPPAGTVTATATATASAPTPAPVQTPPNTVVVPVSGMVTGSVSVTLPQPVAPTNAAPLIIQQINREGAKGKQVIYLNAVGQPRVKAIDPNDTGTGVTNTLTDAGNPYLIRDGEDWTVRYYDRRTPPVTVAGAGCAGWQPTQPRRMFDPRLHESRMAELAAHREFSLLSASVAEDLHDEVVRRGNARNFEANRHAAESLELLIQKQRMLDESASRAIWSLRTFGTPAPPGYGGYGY